MEKRENAALVRLKSNLWRIGYSTIGIAPINTLETYISVWKCGFNCCKGDIRITSDGKLIMCHDSGFTFDIDGYITSFREDDNIPIRNLKYEDCMKFEYTEGFEVLGHHAKVADFEGYIRICSLYGLVAYPTIRDEYMDEVLPEMLRILEKYNMIYRCIINGTTYESLVELRKYDKRVAMVYTLYENETITKELVDRAIALENSGITISPWPPFDDEKPIIPSEFEEGMNYAIEQGIPLFFAFVYSMRQYTQLINRGIIGVQALRPIMPYAFQTYPFIVEEKDDIVIGKDAMIESMCWNFEDNNQILYNPIISDDTYREMVLRAKRWDLRCTRNGDSIVIDNISLGNEICDFPDGVLEAWLRELPSRVSAEDEKGNRISCWVENGKIILNAKKRYKAKYRVLLEI